MSRGFSATKAPGHLASAVLVGPDIGCLGKKVTEEELVQVKEGSFRE
jgi:hypothetical protein